MGSLFSRGRGSTVEVLEHLEKDIIQREKYAEQTQLQQKYIVGRFFFLCLAIYLLTVTVGYFYWNPKDKTEALYRLLPAVCFPALVWFLKTLLTLFFSWKLGRNGTKLDLLKTQKKDILDNVKETETYKHAMEILQKFDPDTIKDETKEEKIDKNGEKRDKSPPQDPQLRRRQVNPSEPAIDAPISPPNLSNTPMMGPPRSTMPMKLARPVLPRERTSVDKVVDYLLGDGPNNRYALVCGQCRSHNGMALQEEFEYISFRCCYCFAFNPARKQKSSPTSPKPQLETHLYNGGSSSPDESLPADIPDDIKQSGDNLHNNIVDNEHSKKDK